MRQITFIPAFAAAGGGGTDNEFDIASDTVTGTGNKTFTLSNMTTTPKAWLVFAVPATTPGTPLDGGQWSMGMGDPTTEFCVTWADEDGQGTTDTDHAESQNAVLRVYNHARSAVAEASYSSASAGSLTLNFSTLSTNVRVIVVAFGGDTLNATVIQTNSPNGANVAIDGHGDTPDLSIHMSGGVCSTGIPCHGGGARMSMGAYDGTTSGSIHTRMDNGDGTTQCGVVVDSNSVGGQVNGSASGVTAAWGMSFDTDGGELVSQTDNANNYNATLCITFGGTGQGEVERYQTPASSTTKDYGSFAPDLGLWIGCHEQTEDAPSEHDNSFQVGGYAHGTSFCIGVGGETGVATTNTWNYHHSDNIINLMTDPSTDDEVASFDSLQAAAIRLSHTIGAAQTRGIYIGMAA